jgi:hypothetical protein
MRDRGCCLEKGGRAAGGQGGIKRNSGLAHFFLFLHRKSFPVVRKKHKLSISIEDDFCLLGIVSDEPDYKLCWLINQELNISFNRVDDLVFFNKKMNEEENVSMFKFYDDNKMITFRLIGNRIQSGYYLSDLRNIDYILHIQGEIIAEEIHALIEGISRIGAVRMCVPVELDRIREREKLHL